MSTTTLSPRPIAGDTEPRAEFRDLCFSEWIKMRSLRSTYWVLALSVVVAIGINLNAVRADLPYISMRPPRGFSDYQYDVLHHGLSEIAAYVMALAAGSFGAITVFGEFGTGMVRTTFAAVPDRRAVIASKVAVVTGVSTLMGAIIALVSFFAANAMVASKHVGLSITSPGCVRAVVAYALLVPMCALIGMMLGAILRHSTASIVGLVALLFIAPLMFGGDRYKLLSIVGHWMPLNAEDRLATNPATHVTFGKYPPSITECWIVYGAWAVVSVIVAIIVVRRRDV